MTDYGTQHRREFILRTVEQQKAAELLWINHLHSLNPDAERLAFRQKVRDIALEVGCVVAIIFLMAIGIFAR